MSTFEEQHGIHVFGSQRYYKTDFTKREYCFEYSSPFIFHIDDTEQQFSTWADLVVFVASYLLKKHSDIINPNYHVEWSKRPIFSNNSSDFIWPRQIAENMFVDVNLTSLHMVWLAQDMLKDCGYDLTQTYCLFQKRPTEEDDEVKKHYIKQNKAFFTEYLTIELSLSEQKAHKIIKILDMCDTYLKGYTENVASLFLFEGGQSFSNFKKKFLEYLTLNFQMNESTRKGIELCITFLSKFYWKFFKED